VGIEDELIPSRLEELLSGFAPPKVSARPEASTKIVEVEANNQIFLEDYAAPGRVGLVGGNTLIDSLIQLAVSPVAQGKKSRWSHAFLFQGRRQDGQNWVIESDLEAGIKHSRLGVQENRISKFFCPKATPALAILDFELSQRETERILGHALDLVAGHAHYSLLEILGTALSLHLGTKRRRRNLLGRRHSMYCSAMIQYVFYKAEIDLVPGVHPSKGTPEDLARSPRIRTLYLRKPSPS